jgi:hypothetical protein
MGEQPVVMEYLMEHGRDIREGSTAPTPIRMADMEHSLLLTALRMDTGIHTVLTQEPIRMEPHKKSPIMGSRPIHTEVSLILIQACPPVNRERCLEVHRPERQQPVANM